MQILFDATRPANRNRRRVFGQGIPTSDHRQPYTQADLEYAAQALNADSEVYVVTSWNDSLDQRAAESAFLDAVESFSLPVSRGGVSKDSDEEAAERYNLAPTSMEAIEAEYPDDRFPATYDEYDCYAARYSIMLGRLGREGRTS